MYRTNGSCTFCVGFRGYLGGFAARFVSADSDLASTGDAIDNAKFTQKGLERSQIDKQVLA